MKLHNLMRSAAIALTVATASLAAGQVVFDQSTPLITQPDGGCPSNFGVKNDSELQNQSPYCANTLGFSAVNVTSRVADDFTVGGPFTITGFKFYAYQTGSPAGPPPTSTMTGAYVQIWNGIPGAGGAVIFGDTATNRMTGSAWSTIYRSSEDGANLDSCQRPIMEIEATIPAQSLPAGKYWVSWGLTGTVASGPWVPPLTLEGAIPPEGNARQLTVSSGTWATLYDLPIPGCSGPGGLYPVGLPFQVLGTGPNPCDLALEDCPADTTDDNMIDVRDLLAVINGWAQNGNPNGPRPDADCAPLPNGDCIVNVTDLLAVINAWGACPGPLGSCYFPNGSCSQLTQAQCKAARGCYIGDGSVCWKGDVCDIFLNDHCISAYDIVDGVHNISNTWATTGQNAIPSCASEITRDIWYTYTATYSGDVFFDTCATTGNVNDTVVALYSGSCGELTEIGCGDSDCPSPTGSLSRAFAQVVQGQTYYIRVGSGNAVPSNQGAMVLTISSKLTATP